MRLLNGLLYLLLFRVLRPLLTPVRIHPDHGWSLLGRGPLTLCRYLLFRRNNHGWWELNISRGAWCLRIGSRQWTLFHKNQFVLWWFASRADGPRRRLGCSLRGLRGVPEDAYSAIPLE